MLAKLTATVLLLATTAYTAAIAPVYQYELGLNSTAYQQKFNELVKAGYRLTYVSGYPDEHNHTLFSGIWKKTSTSVPWVARHGLTGAAYDALSAQLKAQKYHPVVLNAYNIENGEPRFATIWEKPSAAVTWQQQRDMTEAGFRAKISALSPLRVTTLTRYTVGNEMRFAATWGKRTTADWHGDWYPALGKPRMDNGPMADGYKAISLDAFSVNGQPMFDAVWQRYSSGGWDQAVTYGQTWGTRESFESGYKYMASQGFGPRVLTGYYVKDCGVQYVGTFEKD
ncbi:hypothetical protein VFPPC_13899 [Pochonia chlamydosporia 170]|uniref:Uncharacterized protein n=1 Tax=Pochonia chlamydosporia 170 TaxID=1380566 RepID=A0A179FFV3_METCM|nr:hypothetical protein VFPPC_13899 [Pochonia chlamydosporia 170]OAQ64485.1 hypothetical protein VFPPC_13899 [Pochonia chlamydosporia 170]